MSITKVPTKRKPAETLHPVLDVIAERWSQKIATCAWRIHTLTRQRAFDKARDNASANDMKPGLWAPVG